MTEQISEPTATTVFKLTIGYAIPPEGVGFPAMVVPVPAPVIWRGEIIAHVDRLEIDGDDVIGIGTWSTSRHEASKKHLVTALSPSLTLFRHRDDLSKWALTEIDLINPIEGLGP